MIIMYVYTSNDHYIYADTNNDPYTLTYILVISY